MDWSVYRSWLGGMSKRKHPYHRWKDRGVDWLRDEWSLRGQPWYQRRGTLGVFEGTWRPMGLRWLRWLPRGVAGGCRQATADATGTDWSELLTGIQVVLPCDWRQDRCQWVWGIDISMWHLVQSCQNNDTQPMKYANQKGWSHLGQFWYSDTAQSFSPADWEYRMTNVHYIVHWCLQSWEATTQMVPQSPKIAVGSLWYKTILQSSVCPINAKNRYTEKTDGWDAGTDALNWAAVLPQNPKGMWWTVDLIG